MAVNWPGTASGKSKPAFRVDRPGRDISLAIPGNGRMVGRELARDGVRQIEACLSRRSAGAR
ncbi:hypothetical protein CK247_31430, partial [Klebsiella pneumoniae]